MQHPGFEWCAYAAPTHLLLLLQVAVEGGEALGDVLQLGSGRCGAAFGVGGVQGIRLSAARVVGGAVADAAAWRQLPACETQRQRRGRQRLRGGTTSSVAATRRAGAWRRCRDTAPCAGGRAPLFLRRAVRAAAAAGAQRLSPRPVPGAPDALNSDALEPRSGELPDAYMRAVGEPERAPAAVGGEGF